MNKGTTQQDTDFVLVHEFNAPKETVFNAFGDAEALNQWWGPVESRNTVISLNFRSGGIFHYKMEFQDSTTYGRFLFGKVSPHDLLEFTIAFADEKGNAVDAPFDIPLPREIFYRLNFSGAGNKTTITLTGSPINASAAETKGFLSIRESMEQGFGATFEKLAVYLGK